MEIRSKLFTLQKLWTSLDLFVIEYLLLDPRTSVQLLRASNCQSNPIMKLSGLSALAILAVSTAIALPEPLHVAVFIEDAGSDITTPHVSTSDMEISDEGHQMPAVSRVQKIFSDSGSEGKFSSNSLLRVWLISRSFLIIFQAFAETDWDIAACTGPGNYCCTWAGCAKCCIPYYCRTEINAAEGYCRFWLGHDNDGSIMSWKFRMIVIASPDCR